MTASARVTLVVSLAIAANALAAPAGYTVLESGIALESGETWSRAGQRYRLYGVQSCLRGTAFTNKAGLKQDCGDASMAVLSAFIKDTHPACAPVARSAALTYVVCYATVAGTQLDLGTALISQGFAFAALNADGIPVNPAYAVAEQDAKGRSAGLWAFPDVQHPSVILGKATTAREPNP
ncbi:succinoglycan biosynthesis protein exoi [Metarhizobium album]|uniref:Succinoglycan biosynthesis protein exoi n=1 Tax=Metarhizobium album TaxID=2182425 RepID=A0A2U2DK59_9HYPH|nr:succinoglycan biosynthesis protein exoi [Rhizobium album]PWE53697.1 succinoglycan biosynthesis protein exoi [Rhizobium album]